MNAREPELGQTRVPARGYEIDRAFAIFEIHLRGIKDLLDSVF